MNSVLDLTWMAWTWPTGAFFLALVLSVAAMGIWEACSPGGDPRRGIFGINTTRGDRLFIAWLGTGFIHLLWLGLTAPPLWIPLGIAMVWFLFVFRWV